LFYEASRTGKPIAVPFFLWLGIFNVMIVAQFWAFANDMYSEEAGMRLFPIVGVGSSLGALVGSKVASSTFAMLGADLLILVSAALLLGGLGLTWFVNRKACQVCARQRANASLPSGAQSGFSLVLTDRYLRLIAAMVVLVNVVNTGGEFLLSKLVVHEAVRAAAGAVSSRAAEQAFIGRFYGEYFTWVSLVGLLVQLFLVSRLFRWMGVRGSLFLLPLIALGGYGLVAAVPILSVAFAAKVCENATDYSVENTARQALFLPVRREAKYQAKTAIDTFFYRLGDMSQAGIVWVGGALALTPRHFAWINIGLVAVWLAIVARLRRTAPGIE
jgi:AAA family ATP:ADP antiporter